MNKSDLITELSAKENLTEADALRIINHIFDGFTDALKNGGRIEIRGFGVFSVREYDGYKGRNPKTGEIVEVKPKKNAFFKVGRELKKCVDVNKTSQKCGNHSGGGSSSMNNCEHCHASKIFTYCKGCEKPVCEDCCRFELIGSGCGCVWPVYYCLDCVINPMINPNAPFRDDWKKQ